MFVCVFVRFLCGFACGYMFAFTSMATHCAGRHFQSLGQVLANSIRSEARSVCVNIQQRNTAATELAVSTSCTHVTHSSLEEMGLSLPLLEMCLSP